MSGRTKVTNREPAMFRPLAKLFRSNKARRPVRPIRRAALGVHQLEDRVVASASTVNYLSLPTGTFAYNQTSGQLRRITDARPSMMSGADGLLYAAYGNGTFSYDSGSDHWTRLTTATPVAMSSGAPTLYASFNTTAMHGTYSYDG